MGVKQLYKRQANRDPKNPFRPGTMNAALYEEDFSDLTISQIADVFNSSEESVRCAIGTIKRRTGKAVQYKCKTPKEKWEESISRYGKNK